MKTFFNLLNRWLIFLVRHFPLSVFFFFSKIIFALKMQLLHTFTRCILRTESEVDFDEAYANRIVSYLLDNFNTILAPSAALTADVSERVNLEQGSQVGLH